MGFGQQKSTKSRSKRISLKQKYKAIKKVREHHKKARKEARKGGGKRRARKDPGIPSTWPFKEALLKEMQARKAQEVEERKQRHAAEMARRQALGQEGGAEPGLEELGLRARGQASDFEGRKRARVADAGGDGPVGRGGGDGDGSRRAYYKEFVRVVRASDVVVQVLDARDPLGCRCLDVERFVLRSNPNTKIVLLLNKIDLVPKEVTEKWLKYLRQELPTVAFKCSTGGKEDRKGGRGGRGGRGGEGGADAGSVLGADTLVQLLKNYARNLDIKTAVTVGIVGLPNVGKSSIINSLKRTKAVATGQTPGLTKQAQEVHLDRHVKLIDSPGVVFTSGEGSTANALRNAVKVERLEDPEVPVHEIVRKCPAKQLMRVYRIPAFKDADEFIRHVAQVRGKLRRGGLADTIGAARLILQDWNTGAIPFYSLPPERSGKEYEASAVVGEWGSAFNAEEVFKNEQSTVIAGLPSLDDSMQPWTALEAGADGEPAPETFVEEMERDEAMAAQADEMDEDGRPRTRARVGGSGEKMHQQNQQLYGEDGMYNPKAAKAAKKRRKAVALDAPYSFDDAEWQEGGQRDGAASSDEESEESDSEMASESSD